MLPFNNRIPKQNLTFFNGWLMLTGPDIKIYKLIRMDGRNEKKKSLNT